MAQQQYPAGIFAPVATIWDADGALDVPAFQSNLDWYAKSPLDGVVLLGSNGEFAMMDTDERKRVIESGIEAIGGRKVVMAGTGAESTRGTIELTKHAADAGADFALVVTPHYYSPRYDNASYLAHYRAVADASPIPVVVYIMAAFTKVDLATGLVNELSQHPNIVGVKDSGGNAPKVGEMVAHSSKDFAVLAGSASFLYAALCLGSTGGILALANVAPDLCKRLEQLHVAGDHIGARALQERLLAPNAALTGRFGVAGLKVAMEMVGLRSGQPRSPLLPLNEKDADEVRRILRSADIGAVLAGD